MKVLTWSDDEALASALGVFGASLGDVVAADASGLADQDPSTIASGLREAAAAQGATLVLVGATKKGKEVGARTAALLDVPYAAEVQSLKSGADGLTVTRIVLSGNSMATYTLGERAVVSAGPGVLEAEGVADAAQTVQLQAEGSPVQVTGTRGEGASGFDLASADVVVGVGRGFKKQEDLGLAEALAQAFPGGAVGCSRPVAADLKWLGEEHWIGLSGHEIRPKAYIAAGVSGQIQHIAGIRRSKLIVAINTNKDAPIFSVCDYGIVGDLYKVLPELTKALKA